MARDSDLAHLHPIVREKIETLIPRFESEELPFRLFEGYRTPTRQDDLYSEGRTKPGTNKVTNAQAWGSYHQYGMAGDFVLHVDGNWSWKDSGKFKTYWKRLHELAREVGLEPLSWERPHLQLQGVSISQLRAGEYPEGGDESWAENLYTEIAGWSRSSTPPSPALSFGRPALALEDIGSAVETPIQILRNRPRFQVNARNGLRMRGGPGTGFDILATLRSGQIVTVLKESSVWCQVDLEGDGLADGYCHSDFLQAIS